MKKILSLLFAALMISTSSLSVFAENTSITPESLLILGDSISSGYGLENYSPEDKSRAASYGNLLAESYGISDRYTNLAADGITSAELLTLLQSGETDTALTDSAVVVMSIGGNDLLGELLQFVHDDLGITAFSAKEELAETFKDVRIIAKFQGVLKRIANNLDQFDSNLIAITSYIHEKNPNAKIFVQTLFNPFEEFNAIPLVSTAATGNISALNGKIHSLAEKNSTTEGEYYLIDTAAAFAGRNTELTNIKQGDIHPNAAGHALISRLAKESIDKARNTAAQTMAVQTAATKRTAESTVKDSSATTTAPPIMPFVLLGIAILGFCASVVIYFFRRLHREK